jgi:hypothetical protein
LPRNPTLPLILLLTPFRLFDGNLSRGILDNWDSRIALSTL